MPLRRLIPPERPRVLLVHKRSLYERLAEQDSDPHFEALLDSGDASVANVKASHERHQRGLEEAIEAFEGHAAIQLEVWGRERLTTHDEPLNRDLIVVVGGDGTVLETSHRVRERPLLGVNSDPSSSVGFLCSGTASQARALATAYLEGQLYQRPLSRLSIERNQRPIGPPVLNDLLFAHACPAATSRYIVALDDEREEHKSSGLWVSTAAGSTAAIRSAGGLPMDLSDARVQFRVREPYMHPGSTYKMIAGWIQPGARLELISRMESAGIYLDGPHIHFTIAMGDRLAIGAAEHPLWQVTSRPSQGTPRP